MQKRNEIESQDLPLNYLVSGKEFVVLAFLGEKFVVLATFNDTAVVHYHNVVGIEDG